MKQDDVLTEADIRVANAMITRMSPRVIAGIYARAPIINAALTQIPASASLVAPSDAVPWQALEELMRAMQGIAEIKLARQTKVLHKKRPALIPVLDSVLETYLRRVDGLRRTGDPARDAVELIRSYKRELDAALSALQALGRNFAAATASSPSAACSICFSGVTRAPTRRSTRGPRRTLQSVSRSDTQQTGRVRLLQTKE